ncbi:MAG: hypothetical protein HOY79_03635 [Streptomyces sp.]|nr:hypothetical protein [Streptomyces sp.]
MSNTHRLTVTATGPKTTTVRLDGHDIANALTGLTLTLGVDRVPEAHLELLLIDVTDIQDIDARILISDTAREMLVALGWTPPAEPEPTDDLAITPYLVVHRYRTDRGDWAWSWNCDGDGTCKGHRALDLSNRAHAERNAREHLATEHPADAAMEDRSATSDHD